MRVFTEEYKVIKLSNLISCQPNQDILAQNHAVRMYKTVSTKKNNSTVFIKFFDNKDNFLKNHSLEIYKILCKDFA